MLLNFMELQRSRVDQMLERLLPPETEYPSSIHRAMRNSVFAGGKRIRPVLCLETGALFLEEDELLLEPACALELIHTYSLIHDDLPALDNDSLRRGKPTCHVGFGEATAILAGDGLLTLAFQVLAEMRSVSADRCLQVSREVGRAIGTVGGMIGGQVADLESEAKPVDSKTLEYVHSAKTGALLRTSVRIGAILTGAEEPALAQVSEYGSKIGLAFQIVDDLLDVLSSPEQLGKAAGKDAERKKATYPAFFGVEKSKKITAGLIEEACQAIAPFGDRATHLREIAHYLLERAF